MIISSFTCTLLSDSHVPGSTCSQLKSEDKEDEEEAEARGYNGQIYSHDRLSELERSRCFEAVVESVEAIASARGGGGSGGGSRGEVSSHRQLLKAIESLMGKKVSLMV